MQSKQIKNQIKLTTTTAPTIDCAMHSVLDSLEFNSYTRMGDTLV